MKYLMTKLTCIKDIKTYWSIFGKIVEVHLIIGDIIYSAIENNFDGTYDLSLKDYVDEIRGSIAICEFNDHFTTAAKLREDRINDIFND